jgi:hypothetical protein
MSLIKPTVGRVLYYYDYSGHYYDYSGQIEPLAAIITKVWNDVMINVVVFSEDGSSHGRTSVRLAQEGDSPTGEQCRWMPFQLGQAAKTAELEQQLQK